MTNWKPSVYKLLGFLGSIISLVLFIGSVAPHFDWVDMLPAVFLGFAALLMNFAFFTLMLPQEYRIIMSQNSETDRRFEQIGTGKEFEFTSEEIPKLRIILKTGSDR